MNNKKIGATIFNLRKSLNLTQSELASKIFVSNKAISRWETGEGIPDISNLNELSKLFNVTIDYIVKGEGAESIDNINLESNKLTNNMVLENKILGEEKQEVEKANNSNKNTDEHINKIIKQAEDRVSAKQNQKNSLSKTKNTHNKTKDNSFAGFAIASVVISAVLLFFSYLSAFNFGFSLVLLILLGVNIIFSVVGINNNNKGSTNRLLFTISLCISILAVVFNLIFSLLITTFLSRAFANFPGGFY